MAAPHSQLALPVQLRDDATLENFCFTPRLAALRGLLLQPGEEQFLYVHGPAGSGRSHLLQAACHERAAGTAVYLPLAELRELPPEAVLDGVESLALVCLDDLQAVAAEPAWEEALFHFINRAREQGTCVLVAAAAAPGQLGIGLPDLVSRLAWGLVFQLQAPTDDEKQQILLFRAGRRGLRMDAEAARYILSRAPRDMAGLMALLETLDRDSIALQRALTIPFIKTRLGW